MQGDPIPSQAEIESQTVTKYQKLQLHSYINAT